MKSARAVIHPRNQGEPGEVLRACTVAGGKALIVVHGVIHRKNRIAFAVIVNDLSIVGSECVQVRRGSFHIVNRRLSERGIRSIDSSVQGVHRRRENIQ